MGREFHRLVRWSCPCYFFPTSSNSLFPRNSWYIVIISPLSLPKPNYCTSRQSRSWCDIKSVVFLLISLCIQYLSPLMLGVRISIRARCTTLCDKVCRWLAKGRWLSPTPSVSSTNKTLRHDITAILLKVALFWCFIKQKKQTKLSYVFWNSFHFR